MISSDLKELLKPDDNGLTIYAGIGSSLRRDDGVGPFIIQSLEDEIRETEKIKLLNAGDQPERLMNLAEESAVKKIILFDAASFHSPAGTIRKIEIHQIPDTAFSTHRIPLSIVLTVLQEDLNVEIHCLGIQPLTMDLGDTLSPPVLEAAEEVISCLLDYS